MYSSDNFILHDVSLLVTHRRDLHSKLPNIRFLEAPWRGKAATTVKNRTTTLLESPLRKTLRNPYPQMNGYVHSSLWGGKRCKRNKEKKKLPPHKQKKHFPFPFLTLNRVTAIYGASPAFNTNLDQMQLQLSSALCSNNWE